MSPDTRTSCTRDPWLLDTSEEIRPSLRKRAEKRTGRKLSSRRWVVFGDPKLGDSYDDYTVTKSPTGRWFCTCQEHGGGEYRRKICSHAVWCQIQPAEDEATGVEDGLDPPPAVIEDVHGFQGDPGTARKLAHETHASDLPLPGDPIFGPVAFPDWVGEFRGHQWDCAQEIVDAYRTGTELVFLDGPTGSGKTLIAEMVRRMLGAKAVYCCHGKTLQDQFLRDFDYAQVLKGRANYPTLFGGLDVNCGDCTAQSVDDMCLTGCHENVFGCPYRVAKRGAAGSRLAVLNTAYLLAEGNTERTVFGNRQFGLGIFDECDTLEGELMSHVEVAITERRMRDLDVGAPKFVTKPETWAIWLREQVIPGVKRELKTLPRRTTNLQTLRRRQGWERLLDKLYVLEAGVEDGNWVFDGYQRGGAIFKPIRVDEFGQAYLWRHFPKSLAMSATIVSPDELVESLGWEKPWKLVQAPMTFPVANRPIYVASVANMTAKEKDTAWPQMANAISNVLERHEKSEKVLVHTVSYALAHYLMENVHTDRYVYTYRNGDEREAALAQYRSNPGSVIFAPSLDRGVDFKEDDCRVCIVAKMPFLSLADKQVQARLHSKGGQLWFTVQTVRALVQSTGRGVRSVDDTCTTYILDQQFLTNIYKKSKHLLPQWWKDALRMDFPVQTLKAKHVV